MAVVCLGLASPPGAAATPASAIPWLTESLTGQPTKPAARQPDIVEQPILSPGRGGTGILTPGMTGLAANLWERVAPDDAIAALRRVPLQTPPAARALFINMLLAETDPPAGAGDAFLLARIDRLLEIGALVQAEALIDAAQPDTAPLFRRWFDVEILTGHAERACGALKASPMLSPSTKVQIFCLARSGDWDAASIALSAATEIDALSPAEADLLALFVDPSLIEEIDPPPPMHPMRGLEFVIRETVGLPLSRAGLPRAFLHADTARFVPIRFRMEAFERLVAAGASDPALLFSAYREETPAASGGVWDRAAAVQAIDLATGYSTFGPALRDLDARLAPVGLRSAAARALRTRLDGFSLDGFAPRDGHLAAAYRLLAGSDVPPDWITEDAPLALRAAAVLRGGALPQDLDAHSFAVLEPFLSQSPGDLLAAPDRTWAATAQGGLILAEGLRRLAPESDAGDLAAGLVLLQLGGQAEAARQAAIEVLLLDADLSR